MKKVDIENSWHEIMESEFKEPYFIKIREYIRKRYKETTVYPHPSNIFNAFNSTPVDNVSIVIIGQDPYHGPDQAHGLCFSVEGDVKIPPSLQNIYKELSSDIGITIPKSGNLQKWANQGVLLLNSVLTVEAGRANSHKEIGWEKFTESVIKQISNRLSNIVFMLWGKQAQDKERIIDQNKHLILKAPHPSPLSAYSGFLGCKHFSKANSYLKDKNKIEIDWNLA